MDEEQDMKHWHLGYGLIGYGPNQNDNTDTAHTLLGAAMCARDRLNESADHALETARALAEQGDHAGAWKEFERSETLANAARNLDVSKRKHAPAYRSVFRVRGTYEAEVVAADEDEAIEEFERRLRVDEHNVAEVDITTEATTDNRGKLEETIACLMIAWEVSESERLYTWECSEPECVREEE